LFLEDFGGVIQDPLLHDVSARKIFESEVKADALGRIHINHFGLNPLSMSENIPAFDRRRWGPGGIEMVAGFIVVGLVVFVDGIAAGRASFQIIGTVFLIGGIAMFFAKITEEIRPFTAKWDPTGEPGEVIEEVSKDMKGIVRIRSELWSAKSENPIAPGSKVRITKVEGLQVWVEKLSADSSAN
jgi:membrane protein implicated in regulation of membrane protease activity